MCFLSTRKPPGTDDFGGIPELALLSPTPVWTRPLGSRSLSPYGGGAAGRGPAARARSSAFYRLESRLACLRQLSLLLYAVVGCLALSSLTRGSRRTTATPAEAVSRPRRKPPGTVNPTRRTANLQKKHFFKNKILSILFILFILFIFFNK